MVGLGSRDNRSVGREHEMDARVRHKVGLELGDVDVDGAIEPEGGGQGRNDLRDEAVQVGVSGSLDVEGSPADVVDGFIVQEDSHVGVLQEGVGGEDAVVGFNNGEEGSKTGTGSSADGIEDEEALETGTVVGELADTVETQIYDLFAN
ncbi:hypothetical protein V8G54_002340 [Vigna mungo]|uniref:Uncharacterized protein n=1 Tax=Vigna mungo TaxID=3915 RepID=A0AAQ3P9X3_VIGMU